ncbi:MAG: sugar transferase [Bryobacteraceae bacterium]
MFSRHHRKTRVLYALTDILLTALAFGAAYQTRLAVLPQILGFEHEFYFTGPGGTLLLTYSLLVWVLGGVWMRVYERLEGALPAVVVLDAFRQCAFGAVAVVLFEYVLRFDLSRPFLVFFLLYSWTFLCLFRLNAAALAKLVRREFAKPHYVMVVGDGEIALRIGSLLEGAASYGIRLSGFLRTGEQNGVRATIQLQAAYPAFAASDLPELLRNRVIDEVIFAVESREISGLEELLLLCEEEGVRTRLAVDFFPHVNSRVYLEHLGHAPLLTFSATPHDEITLMLKRFIDIVFSAFSLLLIAPFLAAIALLIRLTSPGPALFRQVRCGLNGRRFVCLKFRSMCENAEALKPQFEHLNQRTTAFKIHNDPRMTSVGRILRKFSLDELPQFWNVLRGDMSLVGPRPAVPEEVEQYKRWQRRRLRMRPGLTCLWALAGRDTLDFESWMRLDMEYIDNWSLALDLSIMLRTVPRVLSGKGAH